MKGKHILAGLVLVTAVVMLAGCGDGGATEGTATEEVPVVASSSDGKVVAEGVIEPARWSELSFEVPGDVLSVLVQECDRVLAGDSLVLLEPDDLERALAQAEVSLRQAQIRLEQLEEPPDETDVQEARSAVSDAAAAYEEAKSNLTVTEHSVQVGDEVRATRRARDQTYKRYQDLESRGEDQERISDAHDDYLDALGAYTRAVENSEYQLMTARNAVTQAYNALVQAQNVLEDLLDGADEKDIEAARLDVEATRLALEEAEGSLEDAAIEAGFDGVVATVHVDPGDSVAAVQVVVVLATLDELQARTVDLTELDVVEVREGQPAVVTVDALPEDEFAGVVSEVALQAGDYRGDVVYGVTVDLTDLGDAPLRWGMTALVEIETD